MENFDITRIISGDRKRELFPVSEEVPFTIEVNGKELSTLLCSPSDLEDLVAGFLFTSGLIDDIASLKDIIIDRQQWKASVQVDPDGFPEDMVFKRIYTSGCGKGVIFHNPMDLMEHRVLDDGFTIGSEQIISMMKFFLNISEEHRLTRGVHSSAAATSIEIINFRDDIGRHNSVDKIIGDALKKNISLEDKMILTSGRISSEIISKALRCGFPVLISAGAPTDQAVKLAKSINLTLIGLARGRAMNIYTGEQRIN